MRYVVFRNLVGQWQWKLVSPNRRIIAESVERYWKKADCEAGIQLCKPRSKKCDLFLCLELLDLRGIV